MTDRELLELAAKAAGLDLTGAHGEAGGALFLFYREAPHGPPFSWAPLDDDGDALRLAVKLGLAVDCLVPEWAEEPQANFTMVLYGPRIKGQLTDRVGETHDADAYAATRRAIVRAAAEIGSA